MSDRDYVIQIEGQSSGNAKNIEAAGAAILSSSRRTSTSSQQSLPSCTSPNYDSGNFSCSNTSEIYIHPIGDSSAEDESTDCLAEFNFSVLTDDVKQLQKDIREKDQMLLLAVADARKVRSELERSVKSERWYKNELRNQKRSRLEILEKLYLNERKFVEENQKLKQNCANLYSVCSEIERKALSEKDSLIKQLQELQRLFVSTKVSDGDSPTQSVIDQLKFELQKQREVVLEKESLIELLKKQKQSLLKDLDNLSTQRDSKILHLQANTFTLDQENRKITKKCVVLVEENSNLEEELKRQEKLLEDTKYTLQQREIEIAQLKEKQQDQLKELQSRANEIDMLKNLVSQLQDNNLREGSNNSENLRLLENYKKEVQNKTAELDQLKSLRRVENDKISKLQVEILSLENLRESYEYTKHEIEQLKFQLQSKELEAENLRIFQVNQTNEIAVLQEKLIEYQRLRENFDKYVCLLQANNETLEARDNEIQRLKVKNAEFLKDLNELRNINCENEKILEQKENILSARQRKIEELQSKFVEQSQTIEDLFYKIGENEGIRKDLADCQNLLQTSNSCITIRDKEIVDLKLFIEDQSKQLLKLADITLENSKLSKEIGNLKKELAQRSEDLEKIKYLNSNQVVQIQKIEKCEDQTGHLQELLEDKISELRNQDIEIETLRLVLKGQTAQIKRFHCKCAENEELREKIEEATNLLTIDNKIFETEAAELEYLRQMAERQALEIYKLTEEREECIAINENTRAVKLRDSGLKEGLLDFEKSNNIYGTQDLEAKAHRIEMMKALLDKKSDKIVQLNCETEKWIELLKNLRISRSRSRESPLGSGQKFEQNSPEIDVHSTGKEILEKIRSRSKDKQNKEKYKVEKNIEKKDMKNNREVSNKMNENRINESIEADNLIENRDLQSLKQVFDVELNQGENNKTQAKMQTLNSLIKTENVNTHDRQTLYTEDTLQLVENKSLQLQKLSLLPNLYENYQSSIVIHPPIHNKENNFTINDIKLEKILRKTSLLKVPENRDSNTCNEENDWKFLKKVLESEQRKKIARYEVHMRTLLDNIKSYKRKLEVMEDRYDKLCEKYKMLEEQIRETESEKEMMKTSYETEIENIMTVKVKEIQKQEHNRSSQETSLNVQELHEISKKYEKSQRIIAVLKHQLETARKQFLEMENYKRISVEFKLNLDNFVDDYAKLLTPLDSYKNSIATDEIYDLIARSNKLVPNFDNLSNSIDALKSDIKNISSCVGGFNPIRKMSLMDELKAADSSRF